MRFSGLSPFLALPLLLACASPGVPPRVSPLESAYREKVDRILAAGKADSRAYERLRHLCDSIGHRLSGSEALDRAIAWAASVMSADGLLVRIEPVTVPKWVRYQDAGWGVKDCIDLKTPYLKRLQFLALGGSVGTPHPMGFGGSGPGGSTTYSYAPIEAEVAVARDWEELGILGESVKGKIVLFHHPMKPYVPGKDPGYGESVDYRVNGASRAAKLGAVGVLVCSATARSLGTPHTGMLRYEEGVTQIPAASLSPEDSEMILRLSEAGEKVTVSMNLSCHYEPDVPSANVVGEIRGSEKPEEIVVFGGHLDSWDVGQGAHDDGGPCVAVMEAMRMLKSLGLKPRRTIRAVLFTNEENGTAGGRQYAKEHGKERHVAAVEADSGAFRPVGFGTPFPKSDLDPAKKAAAERVVARLRDAVALLDPAGAGALTDGGGGADIGPLAEFGVPQIGLEVDMATYFDIHHTHADTFDKIVKEDLDRVAGVLAALVFVLADMEESLRD